MANSETNRLQITETGRAKIDAVFAQRPRGLREVVRLVPSVIKVRPAHLQVQMAFVQGPQKPGPHGHVDRKGRGPSPRTGPRRA